MSDVETTLSDDSYTSRHNAEMKRTPALERRVVRDEVDGELLPLFLEEANTLYPKIALALQAWREQSGADIRLGDKLQRTLHTLKGSARMAGAMRLGELTHRVEGRIADAIE
ncbi:MAG: Hpt domain-containing protein, partial [Gallionellaceae bacterium]